MHITVDDEVEGTPVLGVRNSGREVARVDVTLDLEKNIKDISTEPDQFCPVIIYMISRSVSLIPTRPRRPKFFMEFSTPFTTRPSPS